MEADTTVRAAAQVDLPRPALLLPNYAPSRRAHWKSVLRFWKPAAFIAVATLLGMGIALARGPEYESVGVIVTTHTTLSGDGSPSVVSVRPDLVPWSDARTFADASFERVRTSPITAGLFGRVTSREYGRKLKVSLNAATMEIAYRDRSPAIADAAVFSAMNTWRSADGNAGCQILPFASRVQSTATLFQYGGGIGFLAGFVLLFLSRRIGSANHRRNAFGPSIQSTVYFRPLGVPTR